MPKELENKLEREAHRRHYSKERTNRYVYGTLNRLGMLKHNHAGNLAPDHLLRGYNMKFDYAPTFEHVHGVHIGIVVAVIVVIAYFFGWRLPTIQNFGGPVRYNGDGASLYISTRSVEGWEAVQYHSLGANAGVLEGLPG